MMMKQGIHGNSVNKALKQSDCDVRKAPEWDRGGVASLCKGLFRPLPLKIVVIYNNKKIIII